jgi:hypothetical protein
VRASTGASKIKCVTMSECILAVRMSPPFRGDMTQMKAL